MLKYHRQLTSPQWNKTAAAAAESATQQSSHQGYTSGITSHSNQSREHSNRQPQHARPQLPAAKPSVLSPKPQITKKPVIAAERTAQSQVPRAKTDSKSHVNNMRNLFEK